MAIILGFNENAYRDSTTYPQQQAYAAYPPQDGGANSTTATATQGYNGQQQAGYCGQSGYGYGYGYPQAPAAYSSTDATTTTPPSASHAAAPKTNTVNWWKALRDDQIILTTLLFFMGNEVIPGASYLPWWNTKRVILSIFMHMGTVEFIYYWLHRALHHHFVYSRYHSHKHAFIVTGPITCMLDASVLFSFLRV